MDNIAEIKSLSHDGRGVAVPDSGKVHFLKGALVGEKVAYQVYRKHASRVEGVTESVVADPHPDRVTPKCEAFGRCGGCSLQHLAPEQQRAHHQAVLAEQFEKIAHTQPAAWLPPLTGPSYGYRYKARLGVKYVHKKGTVLVGFREHNGRYIVDTGRCEILHPRIGENLPILREAVMQCEARDKIAQLELAASDHQVALIVRHLVPLSAADQAVLLDCAKQLDLVLYFQPKGPNTIHQVYPADPVTLSYRLPDDDIEVAFLPQDFTQINPMMNQQMVGLAMDLLAPEPGETILDAFCGLGNFTLPIAKRGATVFGVEGDAGLCSRAAENAHRNGFSDVKFYAANLFESIAGAPFTQKVDKLLLDPPRAGALQLVEDIDLLSPSRIVYVSCHRATLARDVGVLVQAGYRLEQAGIMDMFPHTAHVESIAVLTRG